MKTTFFKFNFVSDIFSTTEFLKTAFLTKICTFRTPCTFFSNIKQWRFVQRFEHQYYLCKLNFFLILTSKLIRTLGPDCSLKLFVIDDINMCLLSFAQIVMLNLVLLFVIIPVVAFFWLRFFANL